MDSARNCEGKHEPTPIKWGKDVYEQCPISILDKDACEVISVIEACEGGMGGGFLPSAFLSETYYFHSVRRIVLHEKWKIDQCKGNKE